MSWLIVSIAIVAGVMLVLYALLHSRHVERWFLPYIVQKPKRVAPLHDRPHHVLICIADHFEPHNGGVSDDQAQRRVATWVDKYTELFSQFTDSDGRRPRHTFFYPMEQYRALEVDAIAGLCRRGFGEVEIHLHHDRDTADNLRQHLNEYRQTLAERHGLLGRRPNGEIVYAFVHGNWALDNSHPTGRHCGVCDELSVLRETGCYADFTMPSAPDPTQTRKINSIYYAVGRRGQCRSHDRGIDAGRRAAPTGGLMLIQGPLLLDWANRSRGVLPRIENGCLQQSQPPSMRRLDLWLRAGVGVCSRPDWRFVKLHAHGANEAGQSVLLGDAMTQFHRDLAERARGNPNFRFHYVTAREMYNLAKAAEAGWQGTVDDARDFEVAAVNATSGDRADNHFRATSASPAPHFEPQDAA